MDNFQTTTGLPISTMLDYIFSTIDFKEEEEVERFLDDNPEYESAVQGLMNHVLQTECSREQLEQQFMLGKDKTTAFLKEKLASSEVPDRRIPFPTSYTKELLRKWFAPIPHYQNLLVNVAARTVKSSERYVRCENDGGLLSFSLPAPIASGCDLKIEDTEEEKLYSATLDLSLIHI